MLNRPSLLRSSTPWPPPPKKKKKKKKKKIKPREARPGLRKEVYFFSFTFILLFSSFNILIQHSVYILLVSTIFCFKCFFSPPLRSLGYYLCIFCVSYLNFIILIFLFWLGAAQCWVDHICWEVEPGQAEPRPGLGEICFFLFDSSLIINLCYPSVSFAVHSVFIWSSLIIWDIYVTMPLLFCRSVFIYFCVSYMTFSCLSLFVFLTRNSTALSRPSLPRSWVRPSRT